MASGTFFHPGTVFEYGGAKQYHLPPVIWSEAQKSWINPITNQPYGKESHYKEMRQAEIRKACEDFKPDVIVFELYPFLTFYRKHDVEAIKDHYATSLARPVIASLSRDIIHSATPEESVRQVNEAMDHLLVRGDGVLQKLDDCMPQYKGIKKPIEYLGNVVSPMPLRTNLPDRERPVTVFASGGYRSNVDPNFFETAIKGRKHSELFKHHAWKIIISNNCPEGEFDQQGKYREVH